RSGAIDATDSGDRDRAEGIQRIESRIHRVDDIADVPAEGNERRGHLSVLPCQTPMLVTESPQGNPSRGSRRGIRHAGYGMRDTSGPAEPQTSVWGWGGWGTGCGSRDTRCKASPRRQSGEEAATLTQSGSGDVVRRA